MRKVSIEQFEDIEGWQYEFEERKGANSEPDNMSIYPVGSLSGWTYVGSAGAAHIETRARALVRAFSFNLGVITGGIVFGFPGDPSLSSFLFFHKPYKGNNQVVWRESYSKPAHGSSRHFFLFKNQNRPKGLGRGGYFNRLLSRHGIH